MEKFPQDPQKHIEQDQKLGEITSDKSIKNLETLESAEREAFKVFLKHNWSSLTRGRRLIGLQKSIEVDNRDLEYLSKKNSVLFSNDPDGYYGAGFSVIRDYATVQKYLQRFSPEEIKSLQTLSDLENADIHCDWQNTICLGEITLTVLLKGNGLSDEAYDDIYREFESEGGEIIPQKTYIHPEQENRFS